MAYRWQKEDDDILRKYHGVKTQREIAEIIGCKESKLSYHVKRLGLPTCERKPTTVREFDKCINGKGLKTYYNNVIINSHNTKTVESDIDGVLYLVNKDCIEVLSKSNGALCLSKNNFKYLLEEMQGIYEVYVK